MAPALRAARRARTFPLSVGVANVRQFEGRLAHWPAYVTPSAGGAGFAELARHVLSAAR
jgi:hypothetical protein